MPHTGRKKKQRDYWPSKNKWSGSTPPAQWGQGSQEGWKQDSEEETSAHWGQEGWKQYSEEEEEDHALSPLPCPPPPPPPPPCVQQKEQRQAPFVSALTKSNHQKLLGFAADIPKHMEGLKYMAAKYVSISDEFQANALTTPMLRELDMANMSLQEYLREQDSSPEASHWAETMYQATKDLEYKMMRSNFGKFRTVSFKKRQKDSAAALAQSQKQKSKQERSRSRMRSRSPSASTASNSRHMASASSKVLRPASPVRMASPVGVSRDPSPTRVHDPRNQRKVRARRAARRDRSDSSYTYTDESESEKQEKQEKPRQKGRTTRDAASTAHLRPPGMEPMMPFGSDKPSAAQLAQEEITKKVKKEKAAKHR